MWGSGRWRRRRRDIAGAKAVPSRRIHCQARPTSARHGRPGSLAAAQGHPVLEAARRRIATVKVAPGAEMYDALAVGPSALWEAMGSTTTMATWRRPPSASLSRWRQRAPPPPPPPFPPSRPPRPRCPRLSQMPPLQHGISTRVGPRPSPRRRPSSARLSQRRRRAPPSAPSYHLPPPRPRPPRCPRPSPGPPRRSAISTRHTAAEVSSPSSPWQYEGGGDYGGGVEEGGLVGGARLGLPIHADRRSAQPTAASTGDGQH